MILRVFLQNSPVRSITRERKKEGELLAQWMLQPSKKWRGKTLTSLSPASTAFLRNAGLANMIWEFLGRRRELLSFLFFFSQTKTNKSAKHYSENMTVVLNQPETWGLSYNDLLSQTHDGASVMSGKKKGVQAHISSTPGERSPLYPLPGSPAPPCGC